MGYKLCFNMVGKSYGDKVVLQEFDFSFPRQGVVSLLGPSGCGKTTLLRLAAGLEQPGSGQVFRKAGTRLSMVFQEDRLLDVLTAEDNIQAALGPESQNLARFCLENVGLGDALHLYPQEMSGGMKRRLAIARAVAYGGDILLLDEPFRGLDHETKRQVMRLVFPEEGLADNGALTLLVTHDVEEALAVSQYILLLQGPPLRVCRVLDLPLGEERSQASLDALRIAIGSVMSGKTEGEQC